MLDSLIWKKTKMDRQQLLIYIKSALTKGQLVQLLVDAEPREFDVDAFLKLILSPEGDCEGLRAELVRQNDGFAIRNFFYTSRQLGVERVIGVVMMTRFAL